MRLTHHLNEVQLFEPPLLSVLSGVILSLHVRVSLVIWTQYNRLKLQVTEYAVTSVMLRLSAVQFREWSVWWRGMFG